VAILNLENVEGANITSADAAIWWAFTTIMLVGYGDTFPVSGEGRVVVVLLMMAGLGLAATFAGLFASWFVDAEGEDEHSRALAVLREDVAALREELASKGRRP
jgi:voltage-gated potassium channel